MAGNQGLFCCTETWLFALLDFMYHMCSERSILPHGDPCVSTCRPVIQKTDLPAETSIGRKATSPLGECNWFHVCQCGWFQPKSISRVRLSAWLLLITLIEAFTSRNQHLGVRIAVGNTAADYYPVSWEGFLVQHQESLTLFFELRIVSLERGP